MIIPFYIPASHKPKWYPKEGKLLQFPDKEKEEESAGDFLERLREIVRQQENQ